jgi:PAS domain S-box-containing protein
MTKTEEVSERTVGSSKSNLIEADRSAEDRGRRFQMLVDAVVDYAICMLDPDGIVTTWNSGAQRIDGYCETEIVGRHFSIFFTEEDRDAGEPERALTTALETGRYCVEAQRLRKDGSRFWANVLLRPVYDESGRHHGYARIIRDISDSRRIETALRDSERRLRLFIESVSDYALYILDPDGIVTSWNIGAERIKGYRAEEIIGRHFSIFYTAEDREAGKPATALQIATETGKFADETRRVRKDGSTFAADVVIDAIRGEDGALIGFAKITRDITERRNAETALAESLRQQAILDERQRGLDLMRHTSRTLAKIVEASPLAIVTIDGNDVIGIWNPAAETIYDLKSTDVVGRRWQDITANLSSVDDSDDPPIIDLVRKHGTVQAMETRRRRKDGTIVELSRSAALIDDDGAKSGSLVSLTEDITGRKTTEKHLRQAQKMEAIGQLSGGIAHDFNNLLAIIHGNLELLRDEIGSTPALTELTDDALAAVRRGASLTQRLLAYSRQQQLAPSIVDIAKLATEMVTVLSRIMEESIQIETVIAPGLWKTRIDANQLENAMINLAVNARDAMPQGGRLTIGAENAIIDSDYAAEHAEVIAGEYIMVSISDTGTGMTKDVVARALEPFYTTKPVGRGTGLGLSMVYGFVKQSDGHLMLYSEPGHGTTVKLYLPRARREQDTVEPPIEVATVSGAESAKVVLVVEDDEPVRKLQIRMLSSLGYRTLEAADGPAGLAVLDGNAHVDLLLTDIVLPKGMNGAVFANAARQLRPGLKVIFSSGYAPNAVIRDDALHGAVLLSKPFTRSALADAVRRALTEGASD